MRNPFSRLFQQSGVELDQRLMGMHNAVLQLQHQVTDLQRRLQDYEQWRTNVTRVFTDPALRPDERHTELERLIARHGERIDLLSQHTTEQRKDVVLSDYLVHGDIGGRLRVFVNQDLNDVATQQHSGDERRIAEAVSVLALGLFAEPSRDWSHDELAGWLTTQQVEVRATELDKLRKKAAEIRQAAVDSGHEHAWYFELDASPGDGLQELWPGCDRTAEVEFVVAPAYVVEGDKIYQPQYVFTAVEEWKPAPGPKKAGGRTNQPKRGAGVPGQRTAHPDAAAEGQVEHPADAPEATPPADVELAHGDQG